MVWWSQTTSACRNPADSEPSPAASAQDQALPEPARALPGSAGAAAGALQPSPSGAANPAFLNAVSFGEFGQDCPGLVVGWAPPVNEAFSRNSSPSSAFLVCPLVPGRELLSETKAPRRSKPRRGTICRQRGLGFGFNCDFFSCMNKPQACRAARSRGARLTASRG